MRGQVVKCHVHACDVFSTMLVSDWSVVMESIKNCQKDVKDLVQVVMIQHLVM